MSLDDIIRDVDHADFEVRVEGKPVHTPAAVIVVHPESSVVVVSRRVDDGAANGQREPLVFIHFEF